MIGALAYHVIKTYLFDVRVVCVSLIIGGFILIGVDRLNPKPRCQETAGFTAADLFHHRHLPVLFHDSGRLAPAPPS